MKAIVLGLALVLAPVPLSRGEETPRCDQEQCDEHDDKKENCVGFVSICHNVIPSDLLK